MDINYWKDKLKIDNPQNLDAREVYHHNFAQIMHMQLKAGQIVKPHSSPVDIIFVILEGEIEMQIGTEKQLVYKDAIIHSPLGLLHGLENKSQSDARILVIKTPSPKNF